MRSSKKALLAIVCVAALVFGSMFATYAYLTDSESVTNTFTVGNVGIELDETTGTEYKMVPGVAIDKDPVVTVKGGSEDCWVFLKVDEMGGNIAITDNEFPMPMLYTFDNFIHYQIDTANWTKLNDTENVYYCYASDIKEDRNIKVLGKGFKTETINKKDYIVSWGPNQVATKASVTKEMMDALTDDTLPQLKFTAYAVQYAGFEDKPADAWAVIPDADKEPNV